MANLSHSTERKRKPLMIKILLQNYQAECPPPPHDPRERCRVGWINEWQVRIFSRQDVKYGYFARHGFLHLQLWHPIFRLSILTPSNLTAAHYEIFPIQKWKFRTCCISHLNEILDEHSHAPSIDPLVLTLMEHYFVLRESQSDKQPRITQDRHPSAHEEAS